MVHAETVLDVDRRRRKGVVWGGGCADDHVDVGDRQAGIVERLAGRLGPERGGGFILAGDVALANARALHDPFVGGLDHLLQFAIGHHPFRERCPETANNRTDHCLPYPVDHAASGPAEDGCRA
ncbi:hypothetical protein D3C72_1815600 [compost metagenome]